MLKPVYHEDSTIFVPVDNPALIGKMHRLLRALSLQKARLGAQRKKLHAAEEAILKEAERELNEEFAYVLGLSLEETPAFIRNLIETDEESEEAFAAHLKEKN